MPPWTVHTLLALLLLCPPVRAQGAAVAPGTRVRMQPRCTGTDVGRPCRALVGRLLAPAEDSLVIEDAHGVTHRLDPSTVSRVERSAGYRRHTLLGLGVGTLVGLGTGALLYSGCTTGGEDDGLCGLYYLGTVPAGAVLGMLVGSVIRTERWKVVPAPAAALQILPLPGRTTIALSVRF